MSTTVTKEKLNAYVYTYVYTYTYVFYILDKISFNFGSFGLNSNIKLLAFRRFVAKQEENLNCKVQESDDILIPMDISELLRAYKNHVFL